MRKIYGYILWLVVALVLFASFFHPIHPDEMVFSTIALDILQGKHIYIDMFDHKPPGIHYTLAGWYALFGASVWSLRSLVTLIHITNMVLIMRILEALTVRVPRPAQAGIAMTTLRRGALYCAYVYLSLIIVFHGTYALTELLALPFVARYLYYIVRRPREEWWFVGAGLSIGIALCFKQTAGLLMPVALLDIVLYSLNRSMWKRVLEIGGFLLFCMVPMVFVTLYMAYLGVFYYMVDSVIWFNIVSYGSLVDKTLLYLLIFFSLSLIGIWYTAIHGYRSRALSERHKSVFIWTVMLLIPSLLYRPYHHYWILIVSVVVVFTYSGIYASVWRKNIVLYTTLTILVGYVIYTLVHGYPALLHQTQSTDYRIIFSEEK